MNQSRLALAVQQVHEATAPRQRGANWAAIEKVIAKLAALGKDVPVSEIIILLEQAGVPAVFAPLAASIVESILAALSTPPATAA